MDDIEKTRCARAMVRLLVRYFGEPSKVELHVWWGWLVASIYVDERVEIRKAPIKITKEMMEAPYDIITEVQRRR